MARKRSFDSDYVLANAANIFRQRGYGDVSIADLERVTGLVSGSIYNAFGDKSGLFKAALHHYVQSYVGRRVAAFAGTGATLEDLQGLFLSVLKPPMADGYGCLVNNSIVEFGGGEGIASESVSATLSMMREAIGGVLDREIGPDMSRTATMRLLVLYHGILTLSRGGMSFEAMADVVRAEFDGLRELRSRADVSRSPINE